MSAVSAISYGLCALAFAVLATMLILSSRGRFVGAVLVSAAVATSAWAAMLAWAALESVPVLLLELAELIRSGIWLLFIVILLYPISRHVRWLWAVLIAAVVAMAAAVLIVVLERLQAGVTTAPHETGVQFEFVMASIGLALFGLVLLEQLYRNIPRDRRWAMKFLCLGVGILFAYDLYLYSNALLFLQVSAASWDARGVINALATPLILIAAKRNEDWALPVYVSRHAAFHTAVILAAGGYLLVVSLGGYFVRDFGGTWGEFAQIVFVSTAAICLAVLLFSEILRRRLYVLLNKHFFSMKFDYRAEWLRLTDRLTEESDGLSPYERALQAVAGVVDSRSGAVWRKQEDGFDLAATWRLTPPADRVVSLDAPLVGFLKDRGWIIDMAEYRAEPEKYGNMPLPSAIEGIPHAWAIIPLFHQEVLRGFMLLTEPKTSTEITWEDRDVLKAMGRQVASYLAQYEDAQALSQARQFEAYNQLAAFLMHDLKNLIAQQSLIVRNAEKHKRNPEFVDDALETIGNSVRRMERLLEHLQRRRQTRLTERVDVNGILTDVARRCADREPRPTLRLNAEGLVVETDRDEFAMILLHLVRNAQDATPETGQVTVAASADNGEVVIEVADSGTGMTPEFIRDELFRPFHTTKSTKGMGIGAHQVREFVRRIGGRVDVASVPGRGTRFRITLPAGIAQRIPSEERDSMEGGGIG